MSKSSSQRAELEIAIIEIFNKLNNNSEIKPTKPVMDISSGGAGENTSDLIFKSQKNSNEPKIEITPKRISIPTASAAERTAKIKNNFRTLDCWQNILEEIKDKVSNSLFQMLIKSNAYVKDNNLFIDTNNITFGMVKKFYPEVSGIVEKILGNLLI